jgi:drug/metabolite transporter (DMT)-like permease
MIWFPIALSVAFFSAAESAVLKRRLGDLDPLAMAAYPLAYSWPLFVATLLLTPAPELLPGFWTTLAILAPLNIAGLLLHWSAVNLAEISLVMPLLAFTPAFVILTGFLILGETVTAGGAAGILLIVAGSYALNAHELRRDGPFAPIRALFANRGARMMLGAALLYALCSVLGKKLILLTSGEYGVVYSGMLYWSVLNPLALGYLALRGRVRPRAMLTRPVSGLAGGALFYLHGLTHFWAVSLVQTAYMIAVKRINGLFSVGFGALFGEAHLRGRFVGAFAMFLGALLLTLTG